MKMQMVQPKKSGLKKVGLKFESHQQIVFFKIMQESGQLLIQA